MTDANPTTPPVASGTSASSTGTNTDQPPPGTGPSASPNSQRWRFDFDFNFDPNWLVSAGANPPLSMLNDWVRNRIPTAVGGTPSPGRGRAIEVVDLTGDEENPPAPLPTTSPSVQGAMSSNNNVNTTPIMTRGRAAINQRSQTESGSEGNGNLANSSQSYVVQIQPDLNGEWASAPESPAERAEEHETEAAEGVDRTASDIIRQNPEVRAFFSIVERYAPFVILLLMKGLFDHGSGIICFLALLITFSHANSMLKKEVSKQSKRNILCLLMIAVNLVVCIAFIFYVFEEQKLYATLIFLPTNLSLTSIWTLFWLVGVTDYVAKFLTVIIKAIVLAVPQRVTPFQKRGKYYLFVEQSSQMYRCLLPLYPWICFFVEAYDGPVKVFGFLLAGLYCLFKAGDVVKRIRAWRIAFVKLLQQVHYGTSPTPEELTDAGPNCPICHDSFQNPTRLSCSHIFCEECVSTWFDRERTCPMCRSKVVDDPTYRDGSTTHFIQLF